MGATVDVTTLDLEVVKAVNTGAVTHRLGAIYHVPQDFSVQEAAELVRTGVCKWLITQEVAMLIDRENAAKRVKGKGKWMGGKPTHPDIDPSVSGTTTIA